MPLSTRIREHIRNQWAGLIALFLVVTGGTAYALDGSNTVFSDDITNGQVRSGDVADDTTPFALQGVDIANQSIGLADLAANSVGSAKLKTNAIPADGLASDGSTKLATDSVGFDEIQFNSITGDHVQGDSLTGAEIDESTLDVVQEPLSLRLEDGGGGNFSTILGVVIGASCANGALNLSIEAPPDGAGLNQSGSGIDVLTPGGVGAINQPSHRWTLTYRRASGKQMHLELVARWSQNFDGTNDCLIQGWAQHNP